MGYTRRIVSALLFLAMAVATLPAAETDPGGIPIEIVGRVIFVDVMVNDKGPLKFIVDTGATETVITPRAALEVGLTKSKIPTSAKRKITKSISVGGATVRNLSVYLLDPPQALSLRLDKGIDYHGILGYTFLSRYLLTIDYKTERMTLQPLSRVRPQVARRKPMEDGSYAIPFLVRNNLIYANGKVNGKGPVVFLVDTGAAETLLMPTAAKDLKIKSDKFPGHENVGFAEIRSISFGGAEVMNVPTIIHVIPQDRGKAPQYHGILGYPFMSNFVVSFNYRDKVLTLKPN